MANKVLIHLHNKKKSKMDDQEAEGSCPRKRAMILAGSHIRLTVENVFTVPGQNATVINLENSKIKGQRIWDC